MAKMKLRQIEGEFTVHRFEPDFGIPGAALQSDFFFISKTDDEITVICPSTVHLPSERTEEGWTCLKILGPLDFASIGVLSELSRVLSEARIGILVNSTFDTDYILIQSEQMEDAIRRLQAAGHLFG